MQYALMKHSMLSEVSNAVWRESRHFVSNSKNYLILMRELIFRLIYIVLLLKLSLLPSFTYLPEDSIDLDRHYLINFYTLDSCKEHACDEHYVRILLQNSIPNSKFELISTEQAIFKTINYPVIAFFSATPGVVDFAIYTNNDSLTFKSFDDQLVCRRQNYNSDLENCDMLQFGITSFLEKSLMKGATKTSPFSNDSSQSYGQISKFTSEFLNTGHDSVTSTSLFTSGVNSTFDRMLMNANIGDTIKSISFQSSLMPQPFIVSTKLPSSDTTPNSNSIIRSIMPAMASSAFGELLLHTAQTFTQRRESKWMAFLSLAAGNQLKVVFSMMTAMFVIVFLFPINIFGLVLSIFAEGNELESFIIHTLFAFSLCLFGAILGMTIKNNGILNNVISFLNLFQFVAVLVYPSALESALGLDDNAIDIKFSNTSFVNTFFLFFVGLITPIFPYSVYIHTMIKFKKTFFFLILQFLLAIATYLIILWACGRYVNSVEGQHSGEYPDKIDHTNASNLTENELIMLNSTQSLELSCYSESKPVALRAVGISVSYDLGDNNTLHAVRNVSCTLHAGEVVSLLGENGAGKSSLISALTGLRIPSTGFAEFEGLMVRSALNGGLREGCVSYLPQQNIFLENLTCIDHMCMMLAQRLSSRAGEHIPEALQDFYGGCAVPDPPTPQNFVAHAAKILLAVNLPAESHRRIPKSLSGGQQRRLWLGMAIAALPAIIILDEPTSGVDPGGRIKMWKFIRRAAKMGGSCVLVCTHHLEEAEENSDRHIIMVNGQIEAIGSTSWLRKKTFRGAVLLSVKFDDKHIPADLESKHQYISSHSKIIHGWEEVGIALSSKLKRHHQHHQDSAETAYEITVESGSNLLKILAQLEEISPSPSVSLHASTLEDCYLKFTQDLMNKPVKEIDTHNSLRGYCAAGENVFDGYHLSNNLIDEKKLTLKVAHMRISSFKHKKSSLIIIILMPSIMLLISAILQSLIQRDTSIFFKYLEKPKLMNDHKWTAGYSTWNAQKDFIYDAGLKNNWKGIIPVISSNLIDPDFLDKVFFDSSVASSSSETEIPESNTKMPFFFSHQPSIWPVSFNAYKECIKLDRSAENQDPNSSTWSSCSNLPKGTHAVVIVEPKSPEGSSMHVLISILAHPNYPVTFQSASSLIQHRLIQTNFPSYQISSSLIPSHVPMTLPILRDSAATLSMLAIGLSSIAIVHSKTFASELETGILQFFASLGVGKRPMWIGTLLPISAQLIVMGLLQTITVIIILPKIFLVFPIISIPFWWLISFFGSLSTVALKIKLWLKYPIGRMFYSFLEMSIVYSLGLIFINLVSNSRPSDISYITLISFNSIGLFFPSLLVLICGSLVLSSCLHTFDNGQHMHDLYFKDFLHCFISLAFLCVSTLISLRSVARTEFGLVNEQSKEHDTTQILSPKKVFIDADPTYMTAPGIVKQISHCPSEHDSSELGENICDCIIIKGKLNDRERQRVEEELLSCDDHTRNNELPVSRTSFRSRNLTEDPLVMKGEETLDELNCELNSKTRFLASGLYLKYNRSDKKENLCSKISSCFKNKTLTLSPLALRGIDLMCKDGEFLSILGPNGAGKSSLISILSSYLPSASCTRGGRITLNNVNSADFSLPGYSWVRKHFEDIVPNICNLETLLLSPIRISGIRSEVESIGICPQKDLFFPYASIRSQMMLIAVAKGIHPSFSLSVSIRALRAVGLITRKIEGSEEFNLQNNENQKNNCDQVDALYNFSSMQSDSDKKMHKKKSHRQMSSNKNGALLTPIISDDLDGLHEINNNFSNSSSLLFDDINNTDDDNADDESLWDLRILDKRFDCLSGGMARRVHLAASLLGRPTSFLLDEPTSGVDPGSRRALWREILMQTSNSACIFSSHAMDEVEKLSTRLAIILNGCLFSVGDVEEVREMFSQYILSVTYSVNTPNHLNYEDEIIEELIARMNETGIILKQSSIQFHSAVSPISSSDQERIVTFDVEELHSLQDQNYSESFRIKALKNCIIILENFKEKGKIKSYNLGQNSLHSFTNYLFSLVENANCDLHENA